MGDRFLYLRRPMLRGDDVADLQRRLSALGFDTGGSRDLRRADLDGARGVPTQRGPGRRRHPRGLDVARAEEGDAPPRRARARELGQGPRASAPPCRRTLLGRRIAVGEEGGLDVLVGAVRRRLTESRAQVVPLLHPDGSAQAAAANAAAVEVAWDFAWTLITSVASLPSTQVSATNPREAGGSPSSCSSSPHRPSEWPPVGRSECPCRSSARRGCPRSSARWDHLPRS